MKLRKRFAGAATSLGVAIIVTWPTLYLLLRGVMSVLDDIDERITQGWVE